MNQEFSHKYKIDQARIEVIKMIRRYFNGGKRVEKANFLYEPWGKKKVAVKTFEKGLALTDFANELLAFKIITDDIERENLKSSFFIEFLGCKVRLDGNVCHCSIVTQWYDINLYTFSRHFRYDMNTSREKRTEHIQILCSLAEEIAEGMNYLNNTLNIIHRDLKGENIMIESKNGQFHAKIADFGNSLHKYKSTYYNKAFNFGTLCFSVRILTYNISVIPKTTTTSFRP